MIAAAAVITRALVTSPETTELFVVLAGVVVLLDLGDEEHLVVHRQPEQDREHEQRYVGDDRHRPVEPDHVHSQPYWKTAVRTP